MAKEIKLKPETRIEALRRLFKTYGLVEEDTYKDKTRKFVIMTRHGIDKIVSQTKIAIQYEPVLVQYGHKDKENCIIVRATAQYKDRVAVSFGESNDKNLMGGSKAYPMAMAEKRAKARVVLQLTGFYEQSVYADEEEANHWK